jgi:phosphatidylserine/phosphatidylglycerophosphate/cardiolipin synthase-like enzyme
VAGALESGLIKPPYGQSAVQAALSLGGGEATTVVSALAELEQLGLDGRGAAAWIRAIEKMALRWPRPDLVWSGPEVPSVPARDTRQVYEELMGSIERSAWISSYTYYDGQRAFKVLADRMDKVPELKVRLLLNIQKDWNDTSKPEAIIMRFAEQLWTKDWPGSVRPKVYYDPRSVDPELGPGILHTKAVVVDDGSVFVTSANLTEHALDHNFELGLLVRDRALAVSIVSHFQGLIDLGRLEMLPGS